MRLLDLPASRFGDTYLPPWRRQSTARQVELNIRQSDGDFGRRALVRPLLRSYMSWEEHENELRPPTCDFDLSHTSTFDHSHALTILLAVSCVTFIALMMVTVGNYVYSNIISLLKWKQSALAYAIA